MNFDSFFRGGLLGFDWLLGSEDGFLPTAFWLPSLFSLSNP
jgi:hypothetical protein